MYSNFENTILLIALGGVSVYLFFRFKSGINKFSPKEKNNREEKPDKNCPHCG